MVAPVAEAQTAEHMAAGRFAVTIDCKATAGKVAAMAGAEVAGSFVTGQAVLAVVAVVDRTVTDRAAPIGQAVLAAGRIVKKVIVDHLAIEMADSTSNTPPDTNLRSKANLL